MFEIWMFKKRTLFWCLKSGQVQFSNTYCNMIVKRGSEIWTNFSLVVELFSSHGLNTGLKKVKMNFDLILMSLWIFIREQSFWVVFAKAVRFFFCQTGPANWSGTSVGLCKQLQSFLVWFPVHDHHLKSKL